MADDRHPLMDVGRARCLECSRMSALPVGDEKIKNGDLW
jgi:hypothetical protein